MHEEFLSYFDNLERYCVVLEKSESSASCGHPRHTFLKFKDPYKIDILREYIKIFVYGYAFDIQPCRSERSCLKYITKEDRNPLTNVKI